MRSSNYSLGVHIGHDRGATIIKDGLLFAHIAQDRLDRIKHSELYQIPFDSINAILKYCKIKARDLGAVGFSYVGFDAEVFLTELKDELCSYYKLNDILSFVVPHHLSHALSTYYTSDYDNAIIFIADGSGDRIGCKEEAESVFIMEGDTVALAERRLQELTLDIDGKSFLYNYALMDDRNRKQEISIGRKYEQFTNLIRFKPYQEGKTMGLASYGKTMIDVRQYNFKGLNFPLKVEDLLKEIHAIKIGSKLSYRDFIRRERANLARTIQDFIEHALISIIKELQFKYKIANLCLSGGVFLNCVANHKIIEQKIFKRIHIFPAASDTGESIGAAFYAYKKAFGNLKNTSKPLPYLGLSYSSKIIRNSLDKSKLNYLRLTNSELAKFLARKIANGLIVAILRGRSELGPRALCHRSILVDPRYSEMKRYLNKYVKFRETFRPYAPVVTWEDQYKYFDLKQDSPYMLLSAKVRPPYRTKLRAITHVDNSARVQAIKKDKEPFIYLLLREFEKITGFPVLLNTSFNLAGEPIVESPQDAIKTFLATKIDLLVMENYLVEKLNSNS